MSSSPTNGGTQTENAPADSNKPASEQTKSPRSPRDRSKSPRSPRSPKDKSRSRSRSRSRDRKRRSYSRSRSRSWSKSPKKRADPDPSRVLGVFGLSSTTRESDLRDEFGRFGELDKVELIIDKRTGNSRCFGFIYFARVEDAVKAKDTMNGTKLHGRNIRTDFSTTKKPHSPTPGRYMGRVSRRPSRRGDRYDRDRYDRRSPRRDRYDPYNDRRYRDDRDRDRDRYYDDRDRDRDRYSRDYY